VGGALIDRIQRPWLGCGGTSCLSRVIKVHLQICVVIYLFLQQKTHIISLANKISIQVGD
jgi:hypothetical protein